MVNGHLTTPVQKKSNREEEEQKTGVERNGRMEKQASKKYHEKTACSVGVRRLNFIPEPMICRDSIR